MSKTESTTSTTPRKYERTKAAIAARNRAWRELLEMGLPLPRRWMNERGEWIKEKGGECCGS